MLAAVCWQCDSQVSIKKKNNDSEDSTGTEKKMHTLQAVISPSRHFIPSCFHLADMPTAFLHSLVFVIICIPHHLLLSSRFRLLQNFMKNAKIASPRADFSLKFHRI